ncbi:MAG: YdeI/OmpD-associated family protein, partial [bacterium]
FCIIVKFPLTTTALEAVPTAYAAFCQLAPSHQREYLQYVEEAKRAPTRAKRIADLVAKMSSP